jgi:hypothetical protein
MIVDRVNDALRGYKDRLRRPAWIILGQDEWQELQMHVRRQHPQASVLDPDLPPRFLGVPIAVVPYVSSHLEVVAQ